MAKKVISASHELTANLWSEGLEAEVLKRISVTGFMGKGSDSIIQHKDRLQREPGQFERIGLRMQSSEAPKTTGTAVEGNEQTLVTKYFDIKLDEFADAFKWDNVMSRQRVTFEHRDEAKAALADQLANAWDTSFFNQIAGRADQTAGGPYTTFEGNNTINAPSANNVIYVGQTAEASITTSDTLTLDDISQAKNQAKLNSPAIRQARIPGFSAPLYVAFIHPWQGYVMRQADTRFDKLCRDAMTGGMIGDNPLLTGAMGVWDECLIVENSRVPKGVNGVGGITTRRAILCGAQAAMCVYGRIGGSPNRYRWVEKLFDYDREMGVMAGFVGGIKKTVFQDEDGGGNAFDFGTIVISSHSHASDA